MNEEVTTYQYVYRGITYEYNISDTPKIHSQLQNDPVLFNQFIIGNPPTECVAVAEEDSTAADNSAAFQESSPVIQPAPIEEKNAGFQWSMTATNTFLEEYQKRKERFRDPKIKQKQLWAEIRQQMHDAGFIVNSEEALDVKMHNLKRRYKSVKDNISSTGRGRVAWQYYEKMDEIFSADRTINFGPLMCSMPSSASQANIGSLPENESLPNNNPSSQADDGISNTNRSLLRPTFLYSMRKKILAIEVKKVRIAKRLQKGLDEANRLSKERNDILREMLNLLVARSRSPHTKFMLQYIDPCI